jgi:hypothetical protein
MATTRNMERETTQAARDAMRNATEGTGRLGSTVAGATTEAARAGADLLQRNLETAQRAWEASSQMTSQLLERSMGQFAGTAGISGAEGKTAACRMAFREWRTRTEMDPRGSRFNLSVWARRARAGA